MGTLLLHALVPLLLLASGGALAALDPADEAGAVTARTIAEDVTAGLVTDGITDGITGDVTEDVTEDVTDGITGEVTEAPGPADWQTHAQEESEEESEESDWGHETADEHSTGVAREDMPPVAPMIPTGCNPAMELIASDSRFSIFRAAIEETGLVRRRVESSAVTAHPRPPSPTLAHPRHLTRA